MEIFYNKPENWIDLQNKVAYILNVCGYEVETPKKISIVKGNVEVDVYAKSSDLLILCECKYWESKVPQNIIFAFRTICEDSGANKGFIIAKEGFQSGAYQSTYNTMVKLKTWDEFLELYKESYLRSNVIRLKRIKSKLFRVADDKREYWEYYDVLSKDEQFEVNKLRANLMEIVLTISQLCIMLQYKENEEIGWDIERVEEVIIEAEKMFKIQFLSYDDFFEYLNEQIKNIVLEIEKFYKIKIL